MPEHEIRVHAHVYALLLTQCKYVHVRIVCVHCILAAVVVVCSTSTVAEVQQAGEAAPGDTAGAATAANGAQAKGVRGEGREVRAGLMITAGHTGQNLVKVDKRFTNFRSVLI